MNFQKLKMVSYCVGGRHSSATTSIYADITSKGSKVLIGHCSIYNRKKSISVGDNTIAAKNLGDFIKSVGGKGFHTSKKWQKLL